MRIYGELARLLDARRRGDRRRRRLRLLRGQVRRAPAPGGWLDPGPYGCLGTGLGLRDRRPDRPPVGQVVLLLGDGAAGFSLMDADTLVRHRLPVVMICGNNGIWGLEKHPMQALYGYDVAADLQPQCRYDQVVAALGGAGELVTRPRGHRPGAAPRVRLRRALPGQRRHRPEERLPPLHQRRLTPQRLLASHARTPPRQPREPRPSCRDDPPARPAPATARDGPVAPPPAPAITPASPQPSSQL